MAPAAEVSAAYPLDSRVGDWDTLVGQGWTWLPAPSCELEAKDIRRARLMGVSEPHLRRLHQAAKQMQQQEETGSRAKRQRGSGSSCAAGHVFGPVLTWDVLVNVLGWTFLPPAFEELTPQHLAKAEAMGMPAAQLRKLQEQKQMAILDNHESLEPHVYSNASKAGEEAAASAPQQQPQPEVQPERRQEHECDVPPPFVAPAPPMKRKGWKGFWDRIKPRREEHWAVQGLKWVGIVAGGTLVVAAVVGAIMLVACVAAGCVMACAVLEDGGSYKDMYGKRWHSKYDCPWYRR